MSLAHTLKRLSAALLRDGHRDKLCVKTDDLHDILTEFARSDRIARALQMHSAEGMERHSLRDRFEAYFLTHESAQGLEPDSAAHRIGPDGKYEWAHKQNMWEAYQAADAMRTAALLVATPPTDEKPGDN